MKIFTPKSTVHHPTVWGSNGKEIFPHLGGIVPAGSFIQEQGEFVTLECDHIWILCDLGPDDMGISMGKIWELAEKK